MAIVQRAGRQQPQPTYERALEGQLQWRQGGRHSSLVESPVEEISIGSAERHEPPQVVPQTPY